jgi:hypothetical protein
MLIPNSTCIPQFVAPLAHKHTCTSAQHTHTHTHIHARTYHITGYSDVAFTGEAVSDRVLQEAALKTGPHLTRCRVAGSSCVTDAGLSALVAQFESLERLELEDLGKHISGGCAQTSVHIHVWAVYVVQTY